AELERNRMLGRIVRQEPHALAVKHRAGGDHLGVDEGAAREQAMEEPAVPIGPFHHRGDTEFSIQAIHFISNFRSVLRLGTAAQSGGRVSSMRFCSSTIILARMGRRLPASTPCARTVRPRRGGSVEATFTLFGRGRCGLSGERNWK